MPPPSSPPASPGEEEGGPSAPSPLVPLIALGLAALALVFVHPADAGPDRILAALAVAGLTAWAVGLQLARDRRARRLAREAAREGDRAKSELLRNVGHELRTPLGAVLGMTELALGTALSPEQREYLEKAHASARQLGGLVEDLLDLAQSEEGTLRLQETAFSLPVLVGETLRAFTPRAREKGVELVCRIEPSAPDGVRGDPARLRQLLARLLDNALKFTERGQVALQVRRGDVDPERVELTVSDTGIGIDPTDLRRIFEPFTLVDGSNTRRQGGAGQGLDLCARLVRLMGGSIRAESEPGRGSVFRAWVRLPADPAGDAATERDLAAVAGRKVLVLDGQEASRQTLRELLESLDLRPTVTEDADQALDALKRAAREGNPFAVTILDGRVRGSVAFRARREEDDPLLARTPHVVLESAGEAAGAVASGPSPRLTRPVTRPELLAALRRALSPPALETAKAEPVAPPARRLRVLVAEDNPLNAFMAVRMVESLGHRAEVVENGRKAVDTLADGGYDAALMDVQMPEMDGLEATRLIRGAERGTGRHLRILALTAQTAAQDLEACLAAGMDGCLPKPFSVAALREALEGTPAIDHAALRLQLGDDPEGVREVLEAFLQEAPGQMKTLREAVAGGDAHGLERAAHRLKGALLWLRAERAAAHAAGLEELGRSGSLDPARGMLRELDREMERVFAEARVGGSRTTSPPLGPSVTDIETPLRKGPQA